MPFTLQTMIFRYNYKSNDVFYPPYSFYKVYLIALKNSKLKWIVYGTYFIMYTLLHIICENLHDLYTLNSLWGWKGLTKFIPRDFLNSTLIIYTVHLNCTYVESTFLPCLHYLKLIDCCKFLNSWLRFFIYPAKIV